MHISDSKQEHTFTRAYPKYQNIILLFFFAAEKERNNFILAGLVGIISLIAIIVSGVSLTRPGIPKLTIREMNGLPTGGSTASSTTGHAGVLGTNTNAKIWTIAVGHDYGAHEYRYSIFYK